MTTHDTIAAVACYFCLVKNQKNGTGLRLYPYTTEANMISFTFVVWRHYGQHPLAYQRGTSEKLN